MIEMTEKSDDSGNVKLIEHVKIMDNDTNEVLLNVRDTNDINKLKRVINDNFR